MHRRARRKSVLQVGFMSVLRHFALVALVVSPAAPAESQCSGEYCTSPAVEWGGHDCWAGSDVERCTCSRGSARMTGDTTEYEVWRQSRPPSRGSPIHLHTRTTRALRPPTRPPQGKQYYEYTCCPDDGFNQGEECGDYDPGIDAGGVVVGILFMLLLLIGITCGILGCCYGCPGCPWYQSYVDRAGMRVRVGVMGSITAAHTLGQPVLRRLLPSSDDTPGCPRLWPAPG